MGDYTIEEIIIQEVAISDPLFPWYMLVPTNPTKGFKVVGPSAAENNQFVSKDHAQAYIQMLEIEQLFNFRG